MYGYALGVKVEVGFSQPSYLASPKSGLDRKTIEQVAEQVIALWKGENG